MAVDDEFINWYGADEVNATEELKPEDSVVTLNEGLLLVTLLAVSIEEVEFGYRAEELDGDATITADAALEGVTVTSMMLVTCEVRCVVTSSSLVAEVASDVTAPPFDDVELGAVVSEIEREVLGVEGVIVGVAAAVTTHEQADEMRDGEPAQCET